MRYRLSRFVALTLTALALMSSVAFASFNAEDDLRDATGTYNQTCSNVDGEMPIQPRLSLNPYNLANATANTRNLAWSHVDLDDNDILTLNGSWSPTNDRVQVLFYRLDENTGNFVFKTSLNWLDTGETWTAEIWEGGTYNIYVNPTYPISSGLLYVRG